MSAVSLLSTHKEKPTDDNQKDEVNQSGLDENSLSGGNGDPAVLAMGPVRKPLTYTRDELMRIRNSPLVKQGLENAFAGNEVMALVLKRRSDSPHEEDKGAKGDASNENHKGIFSRERDRERRSADPRERVRKESESGGGIVLSPQRRLFTSGCGAPGAPVAQPPPQLARTRPESPLSATAPQTVQKTEQAGRRIGSGRIMVRDVPTSGWEENEYRPTAEIYRPPGALRERERERDRDRDRERERDRDRDERRDDRRPNGDRFERRSFGRDSFSSDMKRERDDRFNNDKHRERDDNRRSGGRYSHRRYDKEDEPEWFSGGPTSQLETIELRGFDEPVKKTNGKEKENDKWNNNNGSQSPVEKWRKESSSPSQTETANTTSDKDSGVESKPEESAVNNDQPDFNLDEFLQFDQIPDVLTNGTGDTEESRFSRWFRRESPTNDSKHYERLMHNMVDDLDNSTKVEPPTSTMNMNEIPMGGMHNGVAGMNNLPIGGFMEQPFNPPTSTPSLLDLLRANPYPDERPEMNSNISGKIHSLEELEARLRPQPAAHAQPPADRDLSAFKRLLAQVSGGHVVPADRARAPPPAHHAHQNAPAQPMSLLQMLNKSLEKQQQQQQQQQHQQQKVQQQPHIPPELLYKLLHVQRQQQAPSSDMGPVGLSNADRELLQRPEAQAIIHGLKAGEITVQHLMQQLGNPGLQSRHREVLLTILRLNHQRQQMVGSPLPNVNPHLGVSHHQPLRLSPVPQTAFCMSPMMASPNPLGAHQQARIPSPREMIHSQSLMQGAILKKKMEEQRHRRELQQQQIKHPTPISFTPTSVLRKMTAEKESDAPSPKQWSQPHKLPQGRPIVKGNQSGGAPMGYAPSPIEYQYMSQQQMSGVRQFPHQQPRQPVNNTFNMNMSRGMSGGTTLHQLLVNSHQRSLNEVNSGGGDNQLAKWFSPELLARASEGKLPSVHVPNALSLEDLERHHHSPAPPLRN